ncbi:MAG: hypothetical protein IIB17_05245 [Chloroflexi bacterium]|nr:hypothetical protein [Chloroflexota bacterium]
MSGRTTFMIAHRPSTLSYCNAILEIEEGVVSGATGEIDLTGVMMGRV